MAEQAIEETEEEPDETTDETTGKEDNPDIEADETADLSAALDGIDPDDVDNTADDAADVDDAAADEGDDAGVAVGLVVALLSFALVWPEYPVIGAAGSLLGLSVSTVALVRPVGVDVEDGGGWSLWWLQHYPAWTFVLLAVFLFIAWDDVIQHSLGWTTPLDQLWRVDGYGLKRLTPSHWPLLLHLLCPLLGKMSADTAFLQIRQKRANQLGVKHLFLK